MTDLSASLKDEAIEVRGRQARFFRGGRGPAVLLVHGGWGSAERHWEPVFARLAETFEVIAPDLPGFEDGVSDGPHSVDDYADWLIALLDVLGVAHVACVGNSFGASVAWSFACRYPLRCDALVLVNGFPMPHTPLPLRLLGDFAPARALLRRRVARGAYTLDALTEAFFDPSEAPASLRRMLASPYPEQLNRMVDAMILGGSTTELPHTPTLLLWGADDHLKQSRRSVAEKLHREIPGSTLVLIPEAGHLPQRERPADFVAALRAFLGARQHS